MSAQVGDKVGVKKEGKKILFYFNGSHQASMRDYDVTDDVYGFVDLFGSTRQVSIMGADDDPDEEASGVSTRTLKDGSVSFKVPDTKDELHAGLRQTIRWLRDYSPEKIGRNRKAVEAFFHDIIDQMARESDKVHTAEYVADIDDSAEIITSYLNFLLNQGIESGGEATTCYLYLFESCLYFTCRSLKLCRAFHETKLVEMTLKIVKHVSEKFAKSKVCVNCHPVSHRELPEHDVYHKHL